MIRELVTTAAITGAAIGGAPVAGADPQRYDGDVPGMNYDASLGAPCSSWERFIFGRGPSGQAEACHFPPPNQFPPAETGYWVSPTRYTASSRSVRRVRSRRRPRSLRMGCRCCVWEPVDGSRDGLPGPGSSLRSHNRWAFLMIMCEGRPTESPIPRWLRFVLTSDRAGSAWYIGAGFFFAPVLAVLSPWPTITAVLWWIIGLAGLWLGLLGIAMAVGLARVLRSGAEIPEAYWRTLVDYRSANE